MAISLAYPNFSLENGLESMVLLAYPPASRFGIFDQPYGNNLHYEYRFVCHPYDLMRVCTGDNAYNCDILLGRFQQTVCNDGSGPTGLVHTIDISVGNTMRKSFHGHCRHVIRVQTATGVMQQVIKCSHYDSFVIVQINSISQFLLRISLYQKFQ